MKALRLLLLLLVALLLVPAASACPWCRIQAQQAVYTPDFWGTAALLMLPLVVIGLVGAGLHFGGRRPAHPES